MKPTLPLLLFLAAALSLGLSGCAAPVVVAGAAGGASVAHDERSNQAMLDDEIIETKAKDAIYQDPEMAKRIHVNVTSYNRVVLLTGEVLSRSLRDRVVNIVRNLPKVRRVHNEIRIADLTSFGSRTNDTWITSKVKAKMIATKGFDASRVKVLTENGTVFLMGLVPRDVGTQAAEIARQISGVKKVVKVFEYVQH
ncbi:MAG TPA: BON domain-containing protein [Gammaproteobacteria bacterium]|nr:BON domain-containing protein [Gammaproteobacteria bacterium]